MRAFIGSLALLVWTGTAAAEPFDGWDAKVDGQYRVRAMTDSGLDFVDGDSRHNISHRARLGVHLEGPGGVEFRVLLQDVRLWGEEQHTLNDFSADGLDVHEAWVANRLGESFSLRLGRQMFALDDQRIVGAVEWTQRGRAFDGAVVKYASDSVVVQGFGFRLMESHGRGGDGHIANPDTDESDFAGLHIHADFAKAITASVLVMHVFVDDQARTTAGTHVSGASGGLSYALSYYFQASEANGESGTAQLMSARVGYTFDVVTAPNVSLWFDRLDGDGTAEGSFATPFATNHKFYGYMDRFIDTVADPMALGLMDIGGSLVVNPVAAVRAGVDAHVFQAVEPGPDDAKAFGIEIDVHLRWAISDKQSLVAVYGIFMPGDLTEATAGDVTEHLGFLTFDTQL